MQKLIFIFALSLITFFCSCINLNSKQTVQLVNIDQSVSIPKTLALSYANKLDTLNASPYWKAHFKENHLVINRDTIWGEDLEAIHNKNYLYKDLVLIAETISVDGTALGQNLKVQSYSIALIHQTDLHSPDLYRYLSRLGDKFLRPKKCLYAWSVKTDDLPDKQFKKFLSALVSLGVQIPKVNPRSLHDLKE